MKTIFLKSPIGNIKKIENDLKVKITTKKGEITIEGNPEDEYIAEKIIDALNLGFSLPVALLIKNADFLFEVLNVKDYTKRNTKIVKARIIGTKGKTLKTLHKLTQCYFEVKENYVGILGLAENIKNAQEAVISIIRGAKHSNVYSFLEKHQPKPIFDFGLKNQKKKK